MSTLRKPPGSLPSPSILAPVIDRPSPTWRLVLWLAWPVLCQQLLILTVGLSDRFLAGYFQPVPHEQQVEGVGHQLIGLGLLGSGQGGIGAAVASAAPLEVAAQITARHVAYQAAQTSAIYLGWFIASYTFLVSIGSTALVARFVGAGDRSAATHVTNQALLLAVGLGLGGSVAGLLGVEGLVSLLQLRGDAAVFAAAYLRPVFWLLVFQVVESAGIACLIGAGDTRTGLFVLGGVAVLNVPLAWAAFHGIGPLPPLGFEGISWGTALSHLLGCIAVLAILARGRAGLRLDFRQWRPDFGLLHRVLRISVPAGIDSLSAVLGQFWFLSIVNGLGNAASSAHGIALGWEALGYLSGSAFGTAAMTLVGQNLGARRPDRAARGGWTAFGMGTAVMCLMGVTFYVLAPEMFALFCPHEEQRPIIEQGVPVLRLIAFAMPAAACAIILTYPLRGAGDTRLPVLFTWFGFLGVRIPLAYWLARDALDLGPLGVMQGMGLGLYGAWLAMCADLVVRGGLLLHRFAGGRWKWMRV